MKCENLGRRLFLTADWLNNKSNFFLKHDYENHGYKSFAASHVSSPSAKCHTLLPPIESYALRLKVVLLHCWIFSWSEFWNGWFQKE